MESVMAGAEIVSFSGDKLLGGPQAGIIVGKKEYIDQIKQNQLARAIRCDKITFAALEATLRLFFDEKSLFEEHETLRLLTDSIDVIQKKAETLSNKLIKIVGKNGNVKIMEGESEIGGGSLATHALPTRLVSLDVHHLNEEELAQKLRLNDPPIIPRILNKQVVFDLRTVRTEEIDTIENAVHLILEN